MSPDQELMAKIKTQWGPEIEEAIAGTPFAIVPLGKIAYGAAMIAAIAANESSGDDTVTRFEPKVLGQLAFVHTGRKPNFGAVTRENLKAYATDTADLAVARLVDLATSFGPTQIMGYQALAGKFDIRELQYPDTHFKHAVEMLDDFRKRFDIAMDGGPAPLFFHCWNAGSPSAPTFDPQYTARGLERMAIYQAL